MSRRVVIGKMPDGSMRLRTALAGYDALTAPDDPSYISFDSNWADMVRVHAVGTATLNATFSLSTGVPRTSVPFASLGYKPFVEVKQRSGSTIYDDYIYADGASTDQKWASGYDVQIRTNEMLIMPYYYLTGTPVTATFFGLDIYYIIYRVAVPE